jgi:glycopeptide antibiotics resistance protein
LKETLFPLPLDGETRDFMREQGVTFMSRVNLIPFYFGQFAQTEGFLVSAQNIILTMPFGFGLSFIAKFKAKDFLWLALGAGLGIEITQLVISLGLGFPYRIIDINDVLFNATGVLIGYGLFRVFALLYLVITQRLGIEHRGLPAYVHDIASQNQ